MYEAYASDNVKTEIERRKNEFINVLTEALKERNGSNLEKLIHKLEHSDFFTAPASTKYHGAYMGGLVDHSLNVYYNMMSIAKSKHLLATYQEVRVTDDYGNETGEVRQELIEGCIDPNSIAIVALLHDISKMNLYVLGVRNKKVYSEHGSKSDNNGRFEWVSVRQYEMAPVENRFLYGSHEETSEFMVRQFIPLTPEESVAILHHHFTTNYDSIKDAGVVSNIYNKYTLAILLHVADMISCFIDERY